MGKKSKHIAKTKPSVSVVTITQSKRFGCIEILFDIIKNQTYKNIIEWIIVEGSRTLDDAKINEINIQNLITQRQHELTFPIVYIKKEKNIKLGELRNIGNKYCMGDITVCMDDDDYYFPNRIEHVVEKLSDSNCKIAGCSNHLMYDWDLNILVQMKPLSLTHSINSCMGWKKEYILTNSHDPEKEFGEELSFTKNFTEPMVQLDPYSTVILSSHSSNTYSKKKFFIGYLNQIPCSIDKQISIPIEKYIPNEFLCRYKKLFLEQYKTEHVDYDVDYDIVYMCGCFSIEWDPVDNKLGGSEQAVVKLSENWVRLGKSVVVYGEIPEKTINGVVYKPWTKFDFNPNREYKNLILWRNYGLSTIIPLNIKAKFICVDIHDNFIGQLQEIFKKYYTKCNKVFLKSNYHSECLLNKIDSSYNVDNIVVIPNGIRVDEFSICPPNIQRNPYRFVYCSCYTRGLDKIIGILWPIIYKYEPRAELHVYYGMDGIRDEKYRNLLRALLAQPGVMDHGRQSVEMVRREKYISTFHFYITNTEAEIDCISIKESLVTGCIPLLSNFGVFKEREGIHFDFNNEKEIRMAAVRIVSLFKKPEEINKLSEKYKTDPTIIDWQTIASKWLKYFVD